MTGARQTADGAAASFVAIDWGTSSFRGWLMSADGTPLAETRGNEGMLHCLTSGFEPVLLAHLQALGAPDHLPVLICGMAGSRQGWAEAPYLGTPTRLDALHEGAIRIRHSRDIRILPGLSQPDPARPDVMRGEETQLLGATEPDFTGMVCIPGTHSKWISIEGGRVVAFTTYMTGELFAVLSKHSILAHAVDSDGHAAAGEAFRAAVAASRAAPADLTAALFRVRAAQLLGFDPHSDGAARLSGTLIGIEVAGALAHHPADQPLRLIGAGDLCRLYESALSEAGYAVTVTDAEQASRTGLRKAATHIWGR